WRRVHGGDWIVFLVTLYYHLKLIMVCSRSLVEKEKMYLIKFEFLTTERRCY
ncbi:unnamed protein product, partial [Prunus brigantina]